MQLILYLVFIILLFIFFIIYINIYGALEEYRYDNNLYMTIMIIKSKWINYFLKFPLIFLDACVFF